MAEPAAPPTENADAEAHHERNYKIQIDRVHYTVHQHEMTGAELRNVPEPPVAHDRDLFEVVPGHSDRKIAEDETVEIKDGLRFFTAPAHINPGAVA
jgi:hypothetical protein